MSKVDAMTSSARDSLSDELIQFVVQLICVQILQLVPLKLLTLFVTARYQLLIQEPTSADHSAPMTSSHTL